MPNRTSNDLQILLNYFTVVPVWKTSETLYFCRNNSLILNFELCTAILNCVSSFSCFYAHSKPQSIQSCIRTILTYCSFYRSKIRHVTLINQQEISQKLFVRNQLVRLMHQSAVIQEGRTAAGQFPPPLIFHNFLISHTFLRKVLNNFDIFTYCF